MAQPVFIITLFEILAGMCATRFLAIFRSDGSCFSHFEQVLQFQRFNTRGIESLAFVRNLNVSDALAQISKLSNTLLHVLARTEYTEIVLHAALQLFTQ